MKDRHLALWAALLTAGLAACGAEGPQVSAIKKTRDVEAGGESIRWNATSAERFGLVAPSMAPSMEQGATPPGGPPRPELVWETPEGWREAEPTQFRAVNFVIAGDPPIECYLTILSGDAGGLAANANRWRQQMSQPPSSEADIQALPRLSFFEAEATFIDVEGTFAGMGGDQHGENYRLLGLLLIEPAGSRFLKLIGPKDAVGEQVQNFRNLAASFGIRVAEQPTGQTTEQAPGASSGGLAYEAPEHWEAAPAQSMRQINFFVGPNREVECYVTVLAGSGGGPLANFNRWCGQMGRAELSPAEFDALERFQMLGGEATMAEIGGSFQAIDDAMMLGVVGNSAGGATFVKMIGPRDLVAAEREAFLSFSKSLRTEG
jgi:hypothetical protein